jgi:peptidoglycan/LPS O-acetylase OafA/YrhL
MLTGHRDGTIDLLRGISISLVMLNHFNIAYRLSDSALSDLIPASAIRAVAWNGNYGVIMFFVISGFLITSNALRRWPDLGNMPIAAFYFMRAARILPNLALLVLVVTILGTGGAEIFRNKPESGPPISFFMADLAAMTGWINVLMASAGWFNYALCVLWSLAIEETFYLSFPILCAALRRKALLAAFWSILIIVGPLHRAAYPGDEYQILYSYFSCFDTIAIGCCAALWARERALPQKWAIAMRIGAVPILAATYLAGGIIDQGAWSITVFALATAAFLVGNSIPADVPGRGAWAPLRWLGRHSYEVYLFHLVVLGTMRTLVPPAEMGHAGKLPWLILFVIFSALLAFLIARFFAEPANRAIRRLFVADRFAVLSAVGIAAAAER